MRYCTMPLHRQVRGVPLKKLLRDLELKNWRHISFWLVVHICDGKTHSDWLCWVAGSVVTQLADIISSYDQMRTEKETKLLAYTENIN